MGNVTLALPIVPVPCVGTPVAENKGGRSRVAAEGGDMLTGTCQTGQLL